MLLLKREWEYELMWVVITSLVIIYPNQADYKCTSNRDEYICLLLVSVTYYLCYFSVLQADLLALPLSGQQHQGPRLRLLLPPHTGHAGRQPVLHLLVSRTGSDFRRGTAHDSSSSQAALVGLKGDVQKGDEDTTPHLWLPW